MNRVQKLRHQYIKIVRNNEIWLYGRYVTSYGYWRKYCKGVILTSDDIKKHYPHIKYRKKNKYEKI